MLPDGLARKVRRSDDGQPAGDPPGAPWACQFPGGFVILTSYDYVVTIGSKTLRQSLNLYVVRASHQWVSEVGDLFVTPDPTARSHEYVRSATRVSGPGLTLQRMPPDQAENAFTYLLDEIHETRVSCGSAMFMEVGEYVEARRDVLVGVLCAAVEAR